MPKGSGGSRISDGKGPTYRGLAIWNTPLVLGEVWLNFEKFIFRKKWEDELGIYSPSKIVSLSKFSP